MWKRKLVPSISLLVLTAGCGALFNSGPAHVTFNSNPTAAEVWIDGVQRGTTPLNLDLAKNKSYTVVMKKGGYTDAVFNLEKKVGSTWVILDVLAGGLPVIVDAATGSWYALSTQNVLLTLSPRAAMEGRLSPDQLAAVRLGAPIASYVSLPSPAAP